MGVRVKIWGIYIKSGHISLYQISEDVTNAGRTTSKVRATQLLIREPLSFAMCIFKSVFVNMYFHKVYFHENILFHMSTEPGGCECVRHWFFQIDNRGEAIQLKAENTFDKKLYEVKICNIRQQSHSLRVLNQQSPNFRLMTLLITLTQMVGHMSAQMMMAENATVYWFDDIAPTPQTHGCISLPLVHNHVSRMFNIEPIVTFV